MTLNLREGDVSIQVAGSDSELRRCFPVLAELRPHLTEETFVAQVKRQMQNHGYRLAYVTDQAEIVAGAGFRVAEWLSWGRALYVDDLVTASWARKRGYGGALLDWLVEEAKRLGCAQFHLDSGPQRHDAHRLYLGRKLAIIGYHFAKPIE